MVLDRVKILNRRLSLLGQEEKVSVQNSTNMSSGGFHSITFNQSPTSQCADVHPQSPSPCSHFPPVKGWGVLG